MRAAVLSLLLLAGCSARQECAATCKGCCDLAGACHPGNDPYACGGAGDCEACLVGQSCVPDAGCSGVEQGSVLQLTGNNGFVPVSAQGFVYASTGVEFLLVSTRDRKVCRHPGVMPNVDEEVLIVTSLSGVGGGNNPLPGSGGGVPALERVIFADAGVVRTEVEGSSTVRTQGARVLGSIRIDTPSMKLEGSIDAPFCGAFR